MSTNIILGYKAFIAEINSLKRINEKSLLDPIKEGKWSVKEIIGHLLYWDKFILEQHISYMADGAKLKAFPNHDLHNEEAMRFIECYVTVDSLIDEFSKNRSQLIDTISQVQSSTEFTIGSGKRKYTVDKYFKIFVDHDSHHLKQIKDALYDGSV